MSFADFFSPLRRHDILFFFLALIFSLGIWSGFHYLIPSVQKITIYFSIKPLKSNPEQSVQLDPVEGSMKIADMIAGWAKNPAFRESIMQESGVYIENFKQKLSARKQNRSNVFWDIMLTGKEIESSDKITQALLTVFEKNFAEFNENNAFPFQATSPQIFKEAGFLPSTWILILSISVGLFLAFLGIYLLEVFAGKLSFIAQVEKLFPSAPVLKIADKLGQHDEKLLEQFIFTFENPRLIGTFAKAEKQFSLAPQDAIDEKIDTPIFLIQLGKTKLRELENLRAIFGENCGIIIFEQ